MQDRPRNDVVCIEVPRYEIASAVAVEIADIIDNPLAFPADRNRNSEIVLNCLMYRTCGLWAINDEVAPVAVIIGSDIGSFDLPANLAVGKIRGVNVDIPSI